MVPFFVYVGGIVILSVFIGWGLITKAYAEGFRNWQLIGISILCLLATSQVGVAIINWLTTILAKPNLLPRMDFSKGIPDEYRTMVVVPTMLNNAADIANLVENLEVRFLANRDANLCFALLTDFKDAKEKDLPEDEMILQHAESKIIELNRKYERPGNDTFFLFHRPRQWNAREKIGWVLNANVESWEI